MKINTLNLTDNLDSLTGLVVVIDVLRAYTTACYILKNGTKRLYPVGNLQQARSLKKQNPDWILIGERNGEKLPDFDYGNSPTTLEKVNLKNKTVIFTTSSGTRGITKIPKADEVLTGAFVNASAIAKYIKKSKASEVTFVCTDSRWKNNEDYKLAEYISDLLLNKKPSFEEIKEHISNHKAADGFLRSNYFPNSKKDFELCFTLDTFNFVIKTMHDEDRVYLKKI